jgi:hypothetical protein
MDFGELRIQFRLSVGRDLMQLHKLIHCSRSQPVPVTSVHQFGALLSSGPVA